MNCQDRCLRAWPKRRNSFLTYRVLQSRKYHGMSSPTSPSHQHHVHWKEHPERYRTEKLGWHIMIPWAASISLDRVMATKGQVCSYEASLQAGLDPVLVGIQQTACAICIHPFVGSNAITRFSPHYLKVNWRFGEGNKAFTKWNAFFRAQLQPSLITYYNPSAMLQVYLVLFPHLISLNWLAAQNLI